MASPFPVIAAAAKIVVDAIPGAPTSVIHKKDIVPARKDLTGGLLVISYGDEGGEEWAVTGNGTSDQGTIGKTYSLWFAYYRTNYGDVSNSTTNPDFIDAAKEALNKGSLSGASQVWNTDLEGHAEWEGKELAQGGEVSRFKLWFQTSEARNG